MLYLCKVCAQIAEWQLSGAEVAQRVAVLQRQLEEAWVVRLRNVQHAPCCIAEPALHRSDSAQISVVTFRS